MSNVRPRKNHTEPTRSADEATIRRECTLSLILERLRRESGIGAVLHDVLRGLARPCRLRVSG